MPIIGNMENIIINKYGVQIEVIIEILTINYDIKEEKLNIVYVLLSKEDNEHIDSKIGDMPISEIDIENDTLPIIKGKVLEYLHNLLDESTKQ